MVERLSLRPAMSIPRDSHHHKLPCKTSRSRFEPTLQTVAISNGVTLLYNAFKFI